MIKLKNLLKEGYAWERKPNKPLPTLEDVQKEYQKKKMKEVLKDIQSGKFTKQWMDEHKSGQKNFLKMREDLAKHPIEKVGKELRSMMPWIGKNKLVDKDKN